MKISLIMISVVLVAASAIWFYAQTTGNLAAEFKRQLRAELNADKSHPQPLLTEQAIASLPAPVQRFLRHNGSIGRPRVTSVLVSYDMELYQQPGSAAMPGPAQQYDRFDPPKRLFFMTTRMSGLPVAVLHDYQGTDARMRVRIASLYDVVNLANRADMARTETVTLLNDLCMFAPSWLTDERLQWQAIDDHSASVIFSNGPHKVKATLMFNEKDELVDFISEDRGALQADGSLRILRWSTPMRNYQSFDGRLYPTEGEAVWQYPEGEFAYGRMKLAKVQVTE